MRTVVIEPPMNTLIDWDQVREHLKLYDDSEQAFVMPLVDAAIAHLDGPEGWLGRAICRQMLEVRFDVDETCGTIRLPYPPIIDLVSISWLDANRQLIVGDLADVELFGREIAPLGMAPWSGCYVGTGALRVRYYAGYDMIPPAMRAAILLMVGDLYENRNTTLDARAAGAAAIPMSTTVEALLDPLMVRV